MVDDRSTQVLNISNVNAQRKTVLNDAKLLELIQKYPFIYNPRVRPYNDTDYNTWAWKNINAAFNRSYENEPDAAFSIRDLMNRWQVLKPLIQCLSKAYDLDAIPQYLRQSVVKITTELDNQSSNIAKKPNSPSQNYLLQQMPLIAQLPKEQKLAMERDILDLILASELEAKQSVQLDDALKQEVNEEVDEFLNDIGLKQVLMISFNQDSLIHHKDIKSLKTYENYKNKNRKFVPLKDAHKFIKPCYVNLKRMNLEDYLPLAKIMQMKKPKLSL